MIGKLYAWEDMAAREVSGEGETTFINHRLGYALQDDVALLGPGEWKALGSSDVTEADKFQEDFLKQITEKGFCVIVTKKEVTTEDLRDMKERAGVPYQKLYRFADESKFVAKVANVVTYTAWSVDIDGANLPPGKWTFEAVFKLFEDDTGFKYFDAQALREGIAKQGYYVDRLDIPIDANQRRAYLQQEKPPPKREAVGDESVKRQVDAIWERLKK